ncbi:hypothetical protein [Parasitella parasitica]|uniref:Uncharacterized protein n=1 Tax=Parasitella parasitica TaxID=35722 RepID=A0A0B7N9U9_9FUNG|nr:hypothetical protein [Parasitella parasitica]
MRAGKTSREFESLHGKRDAGLYQDLRRARHAFNQVYMEMSQIAEEIKQNQSQMYVLNKKVHGQLVPDSHAPVAADNLMLLLANESTIVQGVDPGIVTTATGVATTVGSLFAAINRFEAISDDKIVPHPMDAHIEFGLTANTVNTAVISNQDRKKREKSGMQKKQLQRMAVKRRIREKRFYQRKVAQDKAKTRHENASFITFTGNWSGSGKYVKGHSRRSTRPYYTQLAACEKDFVLSVDEYKSTITCSSCFQRTTKQTQIRDGKVKSIPGAVVCFNPRCQRRISTNATTSNRNRNGATNIAMIGFSSLVSEKGLPLPAFRRIQSNKYALSALFLSHQAHGEDRIPTKGALVLLGDLEFCVLWIRSKNVIHN